MELWYPFVIQTNETVYNDTDMHSYNSCIISCVEFVNINVDIKKINRIIVNTRLYLKCKNNYMFRLYIRSHL